ncbi:alpha/beta hydrolase [Sphingopyxis sp. H050]|jgi:abhydrolase domain-containing protein 6|uniref:alpha/beta fold hydrolase n=1 Tax=Sphingopyxis sp. H050 TaxID=1759072 RepID=UPI000736EC7D|nr:alpha/beta hydrolase [Sphingopyxis sp. H050]KTE21413.1 alpha/beta hydrolase [Sphingopyxis sp. H050]
MKILLILIFAPLISLALFYFLFPGRLVAIARWLLRKRGGTVQKSVTVEGRAWPYLEGGDPAKPTLLLVHGFAGDKDNWSMIAPYLTRDYHVIAPDLPGFGENERNPDLAYDIAAQTARLKAFADALGLSRPHVAGNSMGGWIALRYALDYPDGLASLTLLNNAGVLGEHESDLQKQAANEDYNPLVLANLEDADRLVAMVVHKPPYIPARLKPVLYADGLKYRDQLDHIFWIIANEGRDHPLNDRLGEVRAPTLIIWGRHDRLLDVSCVPVLEAGIPGSRSHIFEHVGHVPMVEDPKATAAVMKGFLAKL